MISFQDLMKGFGVVTVMNACIYKLAPGSTYVGKSKCGHDTNSKALTPFDFEYTHLYIDTLKIANLIQEGPAKTITGGQYSNPLLKYGKTMTMEMQNALGSAEILKTFFGCSYDEESGVLSVSDKFPGAFAIEGETFFIDQKTGQKKKVRIFIPQFIPNGVFNLTQDAEGDASVFDCSGTISVTRIIDTDHPEGHDIFYLISDKSWLGFEMMPQSQQATIRYKYSVGVSNDFGVDYSIMNWPGTGSGYVVTGIDQNADWTIIPDYFNDSPVIGIANEALKTSKNVYVGANVQYIGKQAFATYNKNSGDFDDSPLERIVFANNSKLLYIGSYAFANTKNLFHISLPSSLIFIDNTCFTGSSVLKYHPEQNLYLVDNWVVQCSFEEGAKIEQSYKWAYNAIAEWPESLSNCRIRSPILFNRQAVGINTPHGQLLQDDILFYEQDLGDASINDDVFLQECRINIKESDILVEEYPDYAYGAYTRFKITLGHNIKLSDRNWLTIDSDTITRTDCENYSVPWIQLYMPKDLYERYEPLLPEASLFAIIDPETLKYAYMYFHAHYRLSIHPY